MKPRPRHPEPRTFAEFPEDAVCPVCKTNDDGVTVLVEIDGTSKDGLAEAQPFHLKCAVAERFNREMGILYTRLETSYTMRIDMKTGAHSMKTP
jgi:hypothetical protein